MNQLAKVPSLFAGIGHDLNQTTYFSLSEVNGVAFIQIAVDFFTAIRGEPVYDSDRDEYNFPDSPLSPEEFAAYGKKHRHDLLMQLKCTLRVSEMVAFGI